MFALVALPLPVAIGAAVLQRRLYDVQLAASRALAWGGLWLTLAATYALVVGGVGAMLDDRGATWLPWAAAGVVAVAFAPARDALQGAANRVVYGRWAAPADVLAGTGHRLADAADATTLLQELTDELVDGLGLTHADIRDRGGHMLALSGDPDAADEQIGLSAYGKPVGTLRFGGPRLREADRLLLADLARQIGGVVHATGLVAELRDARERLLLAGEQERRRLRGDLHDGLGPSLAGLGLLVDSIDNRLDPGHPAAADLARLRAGLRETVADVRRLVEGLRPPALDDLGLFGAVAALSRALAGGAGLEVRLDLPEGRPALPAAVEVTAYRVAQEALTNVVRHSRARTCSVAGAVTGDELVLEVGDDGQGLNGTGRGVGLTSMLERAEQIGGRVALASPPSGGTTVQLTLPLTAGGHG
jgi:signal transduction histidine kinase